MRILILVLVLTGTAQGANIYDERSNRIGRNEERPGRIDVYDMQSNRIDGGVRQPDGSIDFRDRQGNRIGRTGPPSTDGSVTFEDASSILGSGDASGPVWLQRAPRK